MWDYVGDNFVHRLVQNTEDGKLVEQEARRDGAKHEGGFEVNEDKVDSLQLEYTYLLTSQLGRMSWSCDNQFQTIHCYCDANIYFDLSNIEVKSAQ